MVVSFYSWNRGGVIWWRQQLFLFSLDAIHREPLGSSVHVGDRKGNYGFHPTEGGNCSRAYTPKRLETDPILYMTRLLNRFSIEGVFGE